MHITLLRDVCELVLHLEQHEQLKQNPISVSTVPHPKLGRLGGGKL